MTAASSGCPTREIELLIADASPALATGTDDMSVLVSGATTSDKPNPNRRIIGMMSIIVDAGGSQVLGSASASCQGAVSTGTRASHSRPSAMRIGPATRN